MTTQTNETEVTIRPLQASEDGDALADLFNAFNESWEGGFMGQGEHTAETALEIALRSQKLEIFVAEDIKGRLLGYCSLHPHPRDKEAAYVGIFGAHPEALGKKVGKRLMLETLAKASEVGKNRVDLNTWAGNFQAMPLYKKIGFFWVPETAVAMENYIPLILNEPAFMEFWKKNQEWYTIFSRELTQAPDLEILEGLNVYTYHFEDGEDHLTVWIDRYAKEILGYRLNVNNKEIEIRLLSDSNEAFRGLHFPFQLSIKSSDTLSSINLEEILPDEVHLTKPIPNKIENINEIIVENFLDIGVKTTLFKPQFKGLSPKIRVHWENQDITLNLGLKVESAVVIELYEESSTYNPAHNPKYIEIVLQNKLKKSLNGDLVLKNIQGFTSEITRIQINLQPEEKYLVTIPLKNINSSSNLEFDCKYIFSTEDDDSTVETELYSFSIPILEFSRFHTIEKPRKERVTFYNGYSVFELNLQGGIFQTYTTSGFSQFGLFENQAVGPPFGLDEFNRLMYNYSVEENNNNFIIHVWAESEQRPGLVLKKKIYLVANSALVRIQHFLENHTKDRVFDLGYQISINFNMGPQPLNYTLPFEDSYVKANQFILSRSTMHFGTDPSRFHESWVALESPEVIAGVFGILWQNKQLQTIRLGGGPQQSILSLAYQNQVQPSETNQIAEYLIYDGPGDWKTIRQYWLQHFLSPTKDLMTIPNRTELLTIGNISTTQNSQDSTYDITLDIFSKSLLKIEGDLTLTSEFGTFNPSKIDFQCSLDEKSKIKTNFKLRDLSNKLEVMIKGSIHTSDYQVEEDFVLPLHFSSSQELILTEETLSDIPGYSWSHPLFKAFSAPSYSAGFVDLKIKGENKPLTSPFPEKPPSFFLAKERGGLRFTLGKDFEDVIQGKDDIEYKVKQLSDNDYQGLEFIPKTLESLKELRFISVKFQFLAHPNSSEIKLIFEAFNNGKGPVDFFGILELSPELVEDLILYCILGKKTYALLNKPHRHIAFLDMKAPIIFESIKENWKLTLELPKHEIAMTLLGDFRPAKLYLGILIPMLLKPNERRSRTFYLRIS